MTETFTAERIFQIAMELEETGQVFYEALAVACGNEQVASLCRRLAGQEVEHYQRFEQMREELHARADEPPLSWEDLTFAQALVNERVIPSPQEARRIAQADSLAETLELAIRVEKDSVEFYRGLLGGVKGEDARAVAAIIKEEETHVQELTAAQRGL
jgi:rubrerythrin